MGAALLILPVGAASADEGGSTEAEVVVSSGIAMFDLPEGFNLTGQPGDIAIEEDFDYRVITNDNDGYNVTVVAAASTLVGTSPNTETIPIARLLARDDAPGQPGQPESPSDTYLPLSDVTELNVHTQPVKSATDGDVLSTGFRMVIPAVNADTYTVALTYLAAVAT